jgi:hypothetical protein
MRSTLARLTASAHRPAPTAARAGTGSAPVVLRDWLRDRSGSADTAVDACLEQPLDFKGMIGEAHYRKALAQVSWLRAAGLSRKLDPLFADA